MPTRTTRHRAAEPAASSADDIEAGPLAELTTEQTDRITLRLLRVVADILAQSGDFECIDRTWVERHLHIPRR